MGPPRLFVLEGQSQALDRFATPRFQFLFTRLVEQLVLSRGSPVGPAWSGHPACYARFVWLPIDYSRIVVCAVSLEPGARIGQHVGLVRVLELVRMGHAQHAASQEGIEVTLLEVSAAGHSKRTHDRRQTARYVADFDDFSLIHREFGQGLDLCSEQAPSLYSYQVG